MIEYKLKESNFKVTIEGLSFYFSSKFYMDKFVDKVENYVESEILKFENRTKVKIALDLVFYISFYKKIEKRGFRIVDEVNKKELSENVSFGINLISY